MALYAPIPIGLNPGFANSYTECAFSSISSCADQLSRYICNKHSVELFGLRYMCVSMTNGENKHKVEIFTVVDSTTDIEIPLFKAGKSRIMTDELTTFCRKVVMRNKQIRYEQLYAVMNSLLGWRNNSSVFINHVYVPSWLDDKRSLIFCHYDNNRPFKIRTTDLPLLHRMLLAYTRPTLTNYTQKDKQTKQLKILETALLPSALGVRKNNTAQSPYFCMINKRNILKYVDKSSIVSLPTLSGERTITNPQEVISYQNNKENYSIDMLSCS